LVTDLSTPVWKAALEAWWALEEATGFQRAGKALPSRRRPEAVGWWVQRGRNIARIPLDLNDDGKDEEREDFYEAVVKWWVEVNPAWRKDERSASKFETDGLKQESNGDLDVLLHGLNGLTSVLACLWWWHHLAGVAEGAPAWRKVTADVTWVLQSASPSSEQPPAKRARR
ncbi:hypothetical protein C8R45DRAFT_1165839, partial [Mycena sanguinolenta]